MAIDTSLKRTGQSRSGFEVALLSQEIGMNGIMTTRGSQIIQALLGLPTTCKLAICAGWTFPGLDYVKRLQVLLPPGRTVLCEVGAPPDGRKVVKKNNGGKGAGIYAVSRGRRVALSPQIGAKGRSYDSLCTARNAVSGLIGGRRTISIGSHIKVMYLSCGEINLLKQVNRNSHIVLRHANILYRQISTALHGIDIIIHPTHDRMGYAARLRSKALWMMAHGPKAYLRVSNWNLRKRQRKNRQSLHLGLSANGQNLVLRPISVRPPGLLVSLATV